MEQLFSGGFGVIVYFVVLFGIMWFIMIRPQKKREKAMIEMQESIKVGDMVITNSGMYGKVVDIVNDLFVIEFGMNKGIRIPISKIAISGIREPDLTIARDTEEVDEIAED